MNIAQTHSAGEDSPDGPAAWKKTVLHYQQPSLGRALWQLISTLGLYGFLWYAACRLTVVSCWLAVPVAMIAGGVLVRMFIIFHDCGHGSFFKSRRANDIIGCITGVLTFTPYYHWRWEHAVHHATAGNLDKRGTGDIWTLTIQEYLESSRWRKFAYRLSRNPLVLFVIAPIFMLAVYQRFPSRAANERERQSVHWMNLAILVLAVILCVAFGLKAYLVVQLTILVVASSAGVWMFYVQHQFEDVHWERGENWDFADAALQGSSYYKLPRILQWFTGNIGFHHIHHLSARIPNYNLERCHRELSAVQGVKPVTFLASLKSLGLRLWDEENHRLVGYREMRARRKAHKAAR